MQSYFYTNISIFFFNIYPKDMFKGHCFPKSIIFQAV